MGHGARAGQGQAQFFLDAAGPLRKHQHAVGELGGLLDVVGDEDDRAGARGERMHQFPAQPQAGLVVQRRERLVHQQDVRVTRQRAGQFHPLAHPAGKLVRVVAGEVLQTDQGQQLRPAARSRSAGRP